MWPKNEKQKYSRELHILGNKEAMVLRIIVKSTRADKRSDREIKG